MGNHELATFLSSHGVRPTQQRIAVYNYLLCNRTHPSADTIYKALVEKFPVFSRTTIYNSLNTLLEAGLIRVVNIQATEQRFDADITDHGHFLCTKCKQIYDFDIDSNVLHSLCPAGFESKQGDIYFTGLCARCTQEKD